MLQCASRKPRRQGVGGVAEPGIPPRKRRLGSSAISITESGKNFCQRQVILGGVRGDFKSALNLPAGSISIPCLEVEAPQAMESIGIVWIVPQYCREFGAGSSKVALEVGGNSAPATRSRAQRVIEATTSPLGAKQRFVGDVPFGMPILTSGGARGTQRQPVVETDDWHEGKIAMFGDLRQEIAIFTNQQTFVETAAERDHAATDDRCWPIEQWAAEHQRAIEWHAEETKHRTVRGQCSRRPVDQQAAWLLTGVAQHRRHKVCVIKVIIVEEANPFAGGSQQPEVGCLRSWQGFAVTNQPDCVAWAPGQIWQGRMVAASGINDQHLQLCVILYRQ